MTDWQTEAEKMRLKRDRQKKLALLCCYRSKLELYNRRIESLEDELNDLGFKPSRWSQTEKWKISVHFQYYSEDLVKRLVTLTPELRAKEIKRLADSRGVSFRSIYRSLQKFPAWTMRDRGRITDTMRSEQEPRHAWISGKVIGGLA